MNKKEELIEKIKSGRNNCPVDEWDSGYNTALEYAIGIVQQLDEPKKEVVPQDVADFIEDGNRNDKIAFLVHQKYLGVNSLMRECPVKDWLRSVDYETVLSLVNGYEVEKEPVWVVENENGYRLRSITMNPGNSLNWSFDSKNKNYIEFEEFETAKKAAYLVTGNVTEIKM